MSATMTTTLLPRMPATTTTSSSSSTGTSTCTPAPSAKHDYAPPGSCEQLWEYNVAVAPAIIFAILFGLVTIGHITLAFVHKKKFALVIIMGTLWETAAYVGRFLGALHQRDQTYYDINFGLTLLAPLWINAFVYMTLGRMIHYFLPERRCGFIKGRLLARCFVIADIICFIIQIGGVFIAVAGTSNHNTKTERLGLNIFNAGAGVQQGFIVIFLTIVTFFVVRARQVEKRQTGFPLRPQGWKWLTVALYLALAMISVRCIFRLCEYTNTDFDNNKLLTKEVYEYVLDAVPMLIASSVFCILHPGLFLVGPESTWPKGSAKKELKRQEKEEKAARKAAKHGRGDSSTNLVANSDAGAWGHSRGNSSTNLVTDTSYGGYGGRGYQHTQGQEDMEMGTFSPSHVAPSGDGLMPPRPYP